MMHEEEVLTTAGARRSQTTWLFVAVSILMACVALPAFAGGNYVGHNTPRYVATAKNLGTEDPSKTIEIGIWLNVHNREEMDALTREMYDRNSPNYRHFLNRAEVAARFAPTAEEAKTVQQFFESHNLKVVNVGPDNFFVRARGTVADVETAFHVQLNNYQVGEKVVRANASDPYVDGDAATLVRAVDGLDSGEYTHPLLGRPTNTSGGSASANLPAVTGSNFFSSDCFLPSTTQTISDGALPIGTYTGNLLNLAG